MEFNGEWENLRIKNILSIQHGKDYSHLKSGNIPVLGTGGIITYVNDFLCDWECVLIGRKGTITKPQFMSVPFWSVDTLFYSKPQINHCPKFQYYLFETIKWEKHNEGSGVPSLSASTIESLKVNIPQFNEQNKIANFLSKIDTRITTQSKIINNYESLIKWIRYCIFGKSYTIKNEVKISKLGEFLLEYSKKNTDNNLQAVAVGKYGIRMRDEIYSKNLSSDYSKNKVIEKDSLIIGMGSTQIDIGILSEDKRYCVSPAYTTYKIKGILSKYLNEYLIYLNPLLSKRYMIIGARQGKSVNKDELLQHKLSIHSIEEQKNIILMFEKFYSFIQKEKDILELYKKQKAYLLQNMFI